MLRKDPDLRSPAIGVINCLAIISARRTKVAAVKVVISFTSRKQKTKTKRKTLWAAGSSELTLTGYDRNAFRCRRRHVMSWNRQQK